MGFRNGSMEFACISLKIHSKEMSPKARMYMTAMPKMKDDALHSKHDPLIFANNMSLAAQEWQQILQELMKFKITRDNIYDDQDALYVGKAFMEAIATLAADPKKVMNLQYHLWQDYMELWKRSSRRMVGKESEPLVEPSSRDRRFRDTAWQENAVFDFIKQSYLISSRWLQEVMHEAGSLDPAIARKVDFYTRQLLDAMAPSNFILTNPEVLKETLETNGENLVKGLHNMKLDIIKGKGKPFIKQTDEEAFTLGKNIATTKGKVVYQNDLMQLIQYEPTTKEVHKTPLLVIPAWINKYYILDLQKENSFVNYLTHQGYTVFMISWVNPDEKLAMKTFEDYLVEGPLEAIQAIEKATGEKQIAAIGYCLGGTLLSIAMSWLAARGHANRIVSATFLTTMVDFSEAGELSIFIDDKQLETLEKKMGEKGYLDAHEMATTFSLLRANDLIWSFVVNNYLLGRAPFPFDLLYWNSDATRMPAAMHSYYLRNMYQNNLLMQRGALEIAGEKIDLRNINVPTYILACKEDHIAPWKSAYAATKLYRGDINFTLAASGHIAGVINPPTKKKYCYWNSHSRMLPASPDNWLEKAREYEGSWWPHWSEWQAKSSGPTVKARKPGEGKLKVIEPAPGSYVKAKS